MRFNGATAMKPWKRRLAGIYAAVDLTLQWGHGDEAVEEFRVGIAQPVAKHASMGPRR